MNGLNWMYVQIVLWWILGIKFLLYIVCRRVPNPMCRALANDHRNDVVSNTAAVACGIIGQHHGFYMQKFALCN